MCMTDQNTIRPKHRLHAVATKTKVLDNNSCLSIAFVEICVTRHWLQAAYSTAQTVARGDTEAGFGACVPSPAEMVSTCQHRLFIAGLCSEVALQEYITPTDRNSVNNSSRSHGPQELDGFAVRWHYILL